MVSGNQEVEKMSEARAKYDEEFKKNAVKLSYASPKTVKQIADDLGVHENLLYNWRKKYTADGDKTRYATLEEENKALKLEVAQVKMERDMLKKATAYFASLHK
jgi:transposase